MAHCSIFEDIFKGWAAFLCLNVAVKGGLCCMYSLVLMKCWLKSVWRALKSRGCFEGYCIGVLGGLGRNLVRWSVTNSYDIWPVLCLNIEVDGRLCLMYSSFLMKNCLKTVWRALKKRGGFERYCIGVLGGLGWNLVRWSVTNSISSLLWISIVSPNFKSHNIIMSARVYFMKRVKDCKDVSIMSLQDEQWRRTSLLCLQYTFVWL